MKKYSKKINLFHAATFNLNIIFIFSNIFLLSIRVHKKPKKEKENSFQISFKNSEYFSLNFLNKTYQYISAYFHNKFNTDNNTNFKENISSKKKVIKVKATGLFNRAHNLKWLKEKLNNKFILEYDSPNPDYLIYNVFNQEDLTEKYRNIDAIRIAFFTENEYPDMNTADYFLANFHIISKRIFFFGKILKK